MVVQLFTLCCVVSGRNKRRVKSETDSAAPPTAPPQGAGIASLPDNYSEHSYASDSDRTVMPVCFHRSLSVEAAKVRKGVLHAGMYLYVCTCVSMFLFPLQLTLQVLVSERYPGSYVAVPSTFR